MTVAISTELRRLAIHAALVVAIGLAASLSYAVAIAGGRQIAWIAIDLVVIGGLGALVWRRAAELALPLPRFAALAGIAFACTLVTQLAIADADGRWVDESAYLATLRAGHILRDGLFPFNLRWLAPILAGPLNVLPVDDADALKALNFGALVVTGTLVAWLLVRLRVRFGLAAVAPVFLTASYLGAYAATNRLVLDPVNYALFAALAHALLRPAHWPAFAVLLVITALDSEKAVYWVPVFAVRALLELGVRRAIWRTLVVCGPACAYLVAMRIYLIDAPTDAHAALRTLYVIAFTPLGGKPPADTSFQLVWFPFGAFTLYALLGLRHAPRALKPLALLIVPILVSTLIATDTQRMAAYAFIVVIPLGYLYLARAVDELPFGRIWFGAIAVLAVAQTFVLPIAQLLGLHVPSAARLGLAGAELVIVGALLYLHLGFRVKNT
jgi:hypothetical protein